MYINKIDFSVVDPALGLCTETWRRSASSALQMLATLVQPLSQHFS